MKYPIAQIETEDGFWLHGLFLETENPKIVFLNIHGTASNFYEEDFIEVMSETFLPAGISVLSTNNRGAGVYNAWDGSGAATEIFEDCLEDIDAWVNFVLQRGYSRIILSGHSLGTEKVVYYMDKGRYKDKIKSVVLLAPADSPGFRRFDNNYQFSPKDSDNVEAQLKEADRMIRNNRSGELMNRNAYGGIMPKTPKSLVNFLGPNTEILKTLPFHSGELLMYRTINVPIFVAIGDQQEYTAIPPLKALELMKKENPTTEAHYLVNCDHDFTNNEEQLSKLVLNFIVRVQPPEVEPRG